MHFVVLVSRIELGLPFLAQAEKWERMATAGLDLSSYCLFEAVVEAYSYWSAQAPEFVVFCVASQSPSEGRKVTYSHPSGPRNFQSSVEAPAAVEAAVEKRSSAQGLAD